MLPIWTHAYSHWMHYKCDENIKSKLDNAAIKNIREALNNNAYIIENDQLRNSMTESIFNKSVQEVACFLYNFEQDDKSVFEVTFYKDNTDYVYKNSENGIKYTKYQYEKIYMLDKETWFDEVFSYPEKEEETEDIIDLDQLNDLSFLGRSLVCKLKEKFIDDRTMNEFIIKFKNETIVVTQEDSMWLYNFIQFFDAYELTKDRIVSAMTEKFRSYDIRTQELILQINEFKDFVTISEETKELEVAYDISDLPKDTDGVKCIYTEDIEGEIEYKVNLAKNNIQVIKSESEGMFVFSSTDKKNVFVSQISDFQMEFTDELYEKKFKNQKKPPWKVKDKNTVVSSQSQCSSLIEYKQQEAKESKNWKFKDPFKPDPWQLHSMKFAGEKILLGHRPGFGKTINSILLAERMRNVCIREGGTPPDIYILAPDRKLQKHWADEVKRMSDVDISHYIFSTYRHLELSQAKCKYPEKRYVVKEEFKDLNTTQERKNSAYKKDKSIRCMICDKPCLLTEVESGLGEESKNIVKRLRGHGDSIIPITHILYKGRNEKRTKKFFWGLDEDKIFFSCGTCVGWNFLTGFSTKNIGEKTYSDHVKNDGPSINDYLLDEYEKWQTFKSEVERISGITGTVHEMKSKLRDDYETVASDQYLSMKYADGINLHLYRTPPNTILICDEIHKFVRESTGGWSLILQTIWKYVLSCRFTILASATPIESSKSELRQLYLISEMLRTKRDYWNDKPISGYTQFDGEFMPPWDIFRPLEKLGDMYDVAARMKNKFSRHNTVANLDKATEDLAIENDNFDAKFKTQPTKLMNLYMGISNNPNALRKDQWIDNGERSNTLAYKMQPDFYNKFTKEALKKLYVLREVEGKEKLFPDLVPYGNGYVSVKIDLNRGLLKDRPPNSELRYLLADNDDNLRYSISVEQTHHLLVKKSDVGYSKKEILDIEQYILENRFDGFITISLQKDDIKPNLKAGLVTNYTDSIGVRSYRIFNERTKFDEIRERIPSIEPVKNLKWLYINPVRQQGRSVENFYQNVPYAPHSLGSKVMEIVITIEDQIRQGKNVMVYHDKVEMLRMIHRALAMRKHKWVNELIDKAKLKPEKKGKKITEAGDFNLSELRNHAQKQALKRWRKLGQIYYRPAKGGSNNIVNTNTRYEIVNGKLKLISKIYDIVAGKYREEELELTNFEQNDDKVTFDEQRLPFEYITEQNKAYRYFDNDEDIQVSNELDYEQLREAYKLYTEAVENTTYLSRHRKYESAFGSENGYNLEICKNLNDFAYYTEYVFEETDYGDLKENHQKFRQLIEGAKMMNNIDKGKITFKKKKDIQIAITVYNELKGKVFNEQSFQSIIYDACKPYFMRAAEIAFTKKTRMIKVYNPEYYHEVYVLQDEFKWREYKKKYKDIFKNKKEVVEAFITISNLNQEIKILRYKEIDIEIELQNVYQMENGMIKKKWELIGEEPPSGDAFIKKKTDEMIFKISNKSLRDLIQSKFKGIKVNENKSLDEIERDNPLDTNVQIDGKTITNTKKRALDYYIKYTVKKGDFNGALKFSKKEKKSFTDYVDRQFKDRKNLTLKRGMPIFLLPDYKKFDFQSIDKFIANNPLIYEKEFFQKANLQNIGKITFNQEEIDNKLKAKSFPSQMKDNFENVLLFGIWTQMYLKSEWEKVLKVENKKATIQANNIEEYADALIHLQKNPYQKKAKSQAKLHFKEKKLKDRKKFVDEMTPVITGMSSKDRIYFAIMDNASVSVKNQPKYVQAFSEGYIDCLLVSDTGVVGIDYQSPSPSFMICIDPVTSAGVQDQFNGRTVRRNSHKNLPEKMRKVEYVAFLSDGIEKIKERDDETKDLKEMIALLKKPSNRTPDNILLYRELQRDDWAENKVKQLIKRRDRIRDPIASDIGNLQELTEQEENLLGLNEPDLKVEGITYDDIMKEKERDIKIFLESKEEELIKYTEIQNLINILSLNDKFRWKQLSDEQKKSIKYKYDIDEKEEEESLATDEEYEYKEFTVEEAKSEFFPENPKVMSRTSLGENLVREQKRFDDMINAGNNDYAEQILNYEWNLETPSIPAGINQLRRLLGCEAHTFQDEKLRDPSRRCDMVYKEDEEKEPDNKKWDFYFDNYVNLSRLVVRNNYAFLSYDEFVRNSSTNDYNNNFCVACRSTVELNMDVCNVCNFPIKRDGEYVYYHLIESESKIQKSVKNKLKEKSKNMRNKEKAIRSRIRRDRLEMVLSLNSIEHQVKQYGDTTYTYSFEENGTKKSFYKRIIRDKIIEENKDWYEIMTQPNVKIFNKLNAIYNEDEKDRLVDTPARVTATEVYRAREVKSVGGFKIAEEVIYDNQDGWYITKFDGDQVEIEKDGKKETVNISDISQITEEDNSEEYAPSDDEIEEEYSSDTSIQSEY